MGKATHDPCEVLSAALLAFQEAVESDFRCEAHRKTVRTLVRDGVSVIAPIAALLRDEEAAE